MSNPKQTRITAKVRFKEMPCRECGLPMRVGSNTRNAPRHVECGIKVAMDNVIAMREKRGPAYDKWRDAMTTFAERESRGSGGG